MSVSRAGFTGFAPDFQLDVWKRGLAAGAAAVLSFGALVVLVQRYDAPVALGVAALLAGAVIMVARPEIATLATVFLLYINFPAVLTKQHGVPHVVAGAFILLLACPLLYSLIIRREPFRADRTFYLMLLLLATMLISVFSAIDRGVALSSVREYVLEGLLLYWLVYNAVRSFQTLRRVIWTLLVAGSLLSALSVYQTLTGSYRQEFGGLAYREYQEVQDDEPREGGAKRRTWDRARGPVNEPNRFAQILIVLIPLAVYCYRNGSGSARLYAAACGLLLVGGVIVTLSRGAFLALLVMALLMTVLRWFSVSRVVVCVVLFAAAAPSVPFFAQRMQGITRVISLGRGDAREQSGNVDTSSLARATLMLAASRVFLDHPVTGVGPGHFAPFYSRKYSSDPEIKLRDLPPGNWRAHSLYLEIAAETGVIGLSAFLAIVVLLLRALWQARRRWMDRPEFADLATAFALSLIAYQLTGVFLHLSFQPYYWLLLSLIGAALSIMRHTHRQHTCYPSP